MSNSRNLLSTKYFYDSHRKEVSKYITNKTAYINVVNANSNVPIGMFENEIRVNTKDSSLEQIFNALSKDVKYDVVILTDIFELTDDLYLTLKTIKSYLNKDGKLILSSINPFWNSLVRVIELLRLKRTASVKSYIKPNKLENILNAASYVKIKSYNRLFIPFYILGIGHLANYIMYLLFPFLKFGIRNYSIYSNHHSQTKFMTKSILIPAKNEEGNLEELIRRVPKFQSDYEMIIICGESRDNTYEKAIEIKNKYTDLEIEVLKQTKNGKANAIWEGLDICKYELIAILDSDLSVDPETLNEFFEIIEKGSADFVNGTRLIYRMEYGAMQPLNKVGNKIFQYLISKLISVRLTDSLCGTKVFKNTDIKFIKNWQENMFFQDPFCDFDLIFSSAYSSRRIVELPVHYRSRKYGSTNISRFRDGWKLVFYFINSYFLFKSDFKKSH
tara:strand:- start:309 stop:1643 length:1335 start_codon:yes stop_codon:yes gene_type:complete